MIVPAAMCAFLSTAISLPIFVLTALLAVLATFPTFATSFELGRLGVREANIFGVSVFATMIAFGFLLLVSEGTEVLLLVLS